MKIVFFGNPDYVLPVLKILYKHHDIVAVVTQPPRPTGRKQLLVYSPVDAWAHRRKIPTIFNFERIPTADLGICAAYGRIIPKFVITNFKFGVLNIHPSLLPKYRGASPIQTAIIRGETQTGATIIKMDDKVDHGPIVARFKEDISPADTNKTLRTRLFEKSAQVVIELINPYTKGKIKHCKQNDKEATFTKIVKKEDGFVNLKKDDPQEIERKLRAYAPWPGIWTRLENQKRLKLLKAHLENSELVLDEVQLEGKDPVTWKQFKEAYPKANFYRFLNGSHF